MVSNLTMQRAEESPLGEIRVVVVVSDYNGFEDIYTVSVALYYFDDLQTSARFVQYDIRDNTTTRNPRFEDTFGGFLTQHATWQNVKSTNWIEENTSLRVEFFFQPVPVTDVEVGSNDLTMMSISISVSISPSARPSTIRDPYIPWTIALVIGATVAGAFFWVRKTSNGLARLAEQRRRDILRRGATTSEAR